MAQLVSFQGEVLLDGAVPPATAPERPICAGVLVKVGPASRALIHLIGANTPLRLDENSLTRVAPPPEPGSGLVDLLRGGLYFLSEVRRTLTVRTPYVNAGVEGTEVYLRTADAGSEMIVLEGRVAATPGTATGVPFAPTTVVTGQQLEAAPGAPPSVTALPDEGAAFGVLRRMTVGALSWTLYYPEVLVGPEATTYPRIGEAARLLVAGQRDQAEAVLAQVPEAGEEGGLAAALRTSIAVARGDAAAADREAARAVAQAPDAAAPRLAQSYARQLALDLDGAVAAASDAVERAPDRPLPQARLAELHLMQGDLRGARRAADAAARLGPSPLTDIVQGFADLSGLRGASAEAAFRRALARESQNPTALLGLGLALIKRGDLSAGTLQLQNAAVADPGSSLLRSYLGKAYFTARDDQAAAKQYAIAKALDPTDPTPWLYDAIRLQLANDPIAALGSLNESIALNDNRAPFRSSLLLDSDASARGTSLARIYDDLGFRQLGLNQATTALAVDPANSAAHRFLADLYLGEPRLEISRASELLQSQMLQSVGMNPVFARAAFTDLNIVANGGPSAFGFNEYNNLFMQDGWQVNADGLVGTDTTVSDELTLTTLQGRTALSLSQFHYETDGFRDNNDLDHNIYSVFGQARLTDDLDVQVQYLHRNSEYGDRAMNFDVDIFDPNQRSDIDQDTARLGTRYRLSPASDLLLSGVYSDRSSSETTKLVGPGFSLDLGTHIDDQAYQGEAQYLRRFTGGSLIAGFGRYRVDRRLRRGVGDPPPEDENIDGYSTYVYGNLALPHDVSATLGLGYEIFDRTNYRDSTLAPKLGLAWEPVAGNRVRLAAFRSLKRALVVDQGLEPTQIVGFNQFYDEFDGSKVDEIALGVDLRPLPSLSVGAEITRAWASPVTDQDGSDDTDIVLASRDEYGFATYAYWTATDRLAINGQLRLSRLDQTDKDAGSFPTRIDTLLVPVEARYFLFPSGFFGQARVSFLHQKVERSELSGLPEGSDGSFLVDLGVGYRIPGRHGIVSVQIANLFDQHISYQDDTFRSTEQPSATYLPSRTLMVQASLQF